MNLKRELKVTFSSTGSDLISIAMNLKRELKDKVDIVPADVKE